MLPFDPNALSEAHIRDYAARLDITIDNSAQLDFLMSTQSTDLQAAPGSGKTTLVGLKLAILADSWHSNGQGICVLSHSNTAKDEITQHLRQGNAASSILQYPHFIGTIQTFADTFLALPYLRSRGIEIHSIDDDAYAEMVTRTLERNPVYRSLHAFLRRRSNGVELATDACFHFDDGELVVPADRLPAGPQTPSSKQFIALKWYLAKRGYFRYEDMFAVSHRYLHQHPSIGKALVTRFPYVLIDEMQDTSVLQAGLLDNAFGSQSVVQRVGDINQAIYGGATQSFPTPNAIDLPFSKRFGPAIARIASATTVIQSQQIIGNGPDSRLVLLTFDASSIGAVVPTFQQLAADRLSPEARASAPPRIVGARKTPGGSAAFPQSISCYVPGFSTTQNRAQPSMLLEAVLSAKSSWNLGNAQNAAATLWAATSKALADCGYQIDGKRPTAQRLKLFLEASEPELYEILRAFQVRLLNSKTDASTWHTMSRSYKEVLAAVLGSQPDIDDFLSYSESPPMVTKPVSHPKIDLAPGQISTTQAAKGETHSATLVLECFLNGKYDVSEALALVASGRRIGPKTPKTVRQAVQLFFVACTRARYLFVAAVERERIAEHQDRLQAAGWEIFDVEPLNAR